MSGTIDDLPRVEQAGCYDLVFGYKDCRLSAEVKWTSLDILSLVCRCKDQRPSVCSPVGLEEWGGSHVSHSSQSTVSGRLCVYYLTNVWNPVPEEDKCTNVCIWKIDMRTIQHNPIKYARRFNLM